MLILFSNIWANSCQSPKPTAVIIADTTDAPLPVHHGIKKVEAQLKNKNYEVSITSSPEGLNPGLIVYAGLATDNSEAARQLKAMGQELPSGHEALAVQKGSNEEIPKVVACGSDANGLMYALLDIARRMGLQDENEPLLGLVKNTREQANLDERGISTYTMQRAWFEERLYNEDYWKSYFDQLAQSRINSFTIIFGYENGGFLAPPYPYFFDTEGFPDVEMANITAEQQKKNVAAFNRMIELAHKRGIKVTTGIWDHIYRGGVQDGGLAEEEEGAEARVSGLNKENLSAYTLKAFEKYLKVFPKIDKIQFRMHPESGLTEEEMPVFWHKVFGLIAESQPGMPVDIRAKQLPDEIINDGIDQGLNIRVTTKYWMEQMGMPFHPTHVNREDMMNRRHGYADLLKYPQRYKVHWRLWSGGTSRILLWGNPQYTKRIANSAHLYNGNSIEFNEPLATKMETQPHNKEPFKLLNAEYQYYDYEFERYWYFFDALGRMAYNPDPPEALWDAAFKKRLGPVAGPELRQGLHLASQVLPRIIATSYNYRYFPTTRGWAEKMHFGDLDNFANGGGTDIRQFVSYEEEAENILNDKNDPRVSVFENSRWFANRADSILKRVENAAKASEEYKNNEYTSTITDLKILAHLARYYSERIKAAVHYKIFEKTNNANSLGEAIKLEEKAINGWQGIVEATGDVYAKDLMMGICRMNMCGHWETDLKQLKEELQQLKSRQNKLTSKEVQNPVSTLEEGEDQEPPQADLERMNSAPVGEPLTITAEVNDPSGVKWVRLRYRHVTQFEDYKTVEMQFNEEKGAYSGQIPGSFIIPKWDVMYFIETMDQEGNGRQYPYFENEAPYVIVKLNRE